MIAESGFPGAFKGVQRSRMGGVGLIEVLITLLIITIGILGVLGLQVDGKRTSYDALQRTVALQLAEDMLVRMRSNAYETESVDVYLQATGIGTSTTGGGTTTLTLNEASMPTTAPTLCTGTGANCDADELAVADLYQWGLAMLGESVQAGADADDNRVGGLVTPTGCISGPGNGSGFVTVTIVWRGSGRASQPADLTCGDASGLYDDAAGDNAYRRHVTVRSYMIGLEP